MRRKDKELALHYLEKVGMADFAHRQIKALSGGQQQRVFLARALAQEADVYVMDEPFAGIDVSSQSLILQLLQEMRDGGKTVLVVHHDLSVVKNYFDWAVLLRGALEAVGPVSDVLTEEHLKRCYDCPCVPS